MTSSMTSSPTDSPPTVGRKKPLLALAAGLLMPGLGQLYLGDAVRGAGVLLAVALAVPAAARLALWGPRRLLCFVAIAGVVAAVKLYLCAAIAAFRQARRPGADAARSWQRPGVYALYVVVGYVFVIGPFTAHARNDLLETFVVPSASMMPSVLPGDRILADKTVGSPGGTKLWRGAVAIFASPNDRTALYIKRIVGLPGDRVELTGNRLVVNGHDLAVGGDDDAPGVSRERADRGAYGVLWPSAPAGVAAPQTFVVPNGQLFVLGDNRGAAVDSRRFGAVPIQDVRGVARQIWFSARAGDGIRWRRVGRMLD